MGTKANPSTFDCYQNAEPDEPIFTLLARDRVAATIVRQWADARERILDLEPDRPTTVGEVIGEQAQIAEARACADEMDKWRAEHR